MRILVVLEAIVTLVLVLVLIAIVGICYRTFRDGGWLERGFGKVSDFYFNYPLIALAVTGALFFGFRAWRARKIRGARSRFFDYVIYVFMAFGIYFIGHYILTGQF